MTIWDRLDNWADKAEPYAAGIAMTGGAIGLGTAATGVGAPIGAAIGFGSQIPSTVIDLYQTGRDWYKVATSDDKPYWNAAWNTIESGLDLFGLKGFKLLAGMRVDQQLARELERRIKEELIRHPRTHMGTKMKSKGMSDLEIAKELAKRAANTVINSKDMIDYSKDQKEKADDKANKINYGISLIPNTIDILSSDDVPDYIFPQPINYLKQFVLSDKSTY